jgi:hypothetical protein
MAVPRLSVTATAAGIGCVTDAPLVIGPRQRAPGALDAPLRQRGADLDGADQPPCDVSGWARDAVADVKRRDAESADFLRGRPPELCARLLALWLISFRGLSRFSVTLIDLTPARKLDDRPLQTGAITVPVSTQTGCRR